MVVVTLKYVLVNLCWLTWHQEGAVVFAGLDLSALNLKLTIRIWWFCPHSDFIRWSGELIDFLTSSLLLWRRRFLIEKSSQVLMGQNNFRTSVISCDWPYLSVPCGSLTPEHPKVWQIIRGSFVDDRTTDHLQRFTGLFKSVLGDCQCLKLALANHCCSFRRRLSPSGATRNAATRLSNWSILILLDLKVWWLFRAPPPR